jgi:hypothetical protein
MEATIMTIDFGKVTEQTTHPTLPLVQESSGTYGKIRS